MYIFGGKSVNPNSLSTFLNDFWSYDVINKKWEQISCRGEIPDPIKGKRKKKRIFKIKKKKKKFFYGIAKIKKSKKFQIISKKKKFQK